MRRFPDQPRIRVAPRLRLLLIALASLVSALLFAPGFLTELPASAQQAGYGQTMGSSPSERQFYDYGSPGVGAPGASGSSLLNTTNPMDLMNKLRRSTALDDATPPSSAVDQALKDLEAASAPRATSPTVKGP